MRTIHQTSQVYTSGKHLNKKEEIRSAQQILQTLESNSVYRNITLVAKDREYQNASFTDGYPKIL